MPFQGFPSNYLRQTRFAAQVPPQGAAIDNELDTISGIFAQGRALLSWVFRPDWRLRGGLVDYPALGADVQAWLKGLRDGLAAVGVMPVGAEPWNGVTAGEAEALADTAVNSHNGDPTAHPGLVALDGSRKMTQPLTVVDATEDAHAVSRGQLNAALVQNNYLAADGSEPVTGALTVEGAPTEENQVLRLMDLDKILADFRKGLLNTIVPVGAGIVSYDPNFDPSVTYGGNWARVVGTWYGIDSTDTDFNKTAGTKIGNKTIALASTNLPSFSLSVPTKAAGYQANGNAPGGALWEGDESATVSFIGQATPFQIVQPGELVFLWKRLPDVPSS